MKTRENNSTSEPEAGSAPLSRGAFLKAAGAGSILGLLTAWQKAPQEALAAIETGYQETLVTEPNFEDGDVLMRMQADLRKALQKPVNERHWVMVIDLRKCVGCHACTIACVAENKLPPGVVYRQVVEEELGKYPNVTLRFMPRPCLQCDKPPCVPVCPVNATYMRPDGVVVMDYDRCIGCRYCMNACPYNSRYFDFGFSNYDDAPVADGLIFGKAEGGVLEELPSFEYGKAQTRQRERSPIGNVRKCHFCLHRVEVGELPACTTTCIGRATFFGDSNDPESLVSELIASPNVMRLREELGTEPKVYYLL
jgi:Fe-S-cluster-containing dehydrogenase component